MKPQKELVNAYVKNAGAYVAYAQHSVTWRFIEKPALERHLKSMLKKNSRILEAGCGYGRVIELLIRKGVPQAQIVGIDYSQPMLDIAQRLFSKVRFVRSDLKKFIPRLGKFDIILCTMTLEHFDAREVKKVLQHFNRYLKTKGMLICISAHPQRTGRGRRYEQEGWQHVPTSWGKTLPFYHRPVSSFVNALAVAGFCTEKIEDAGLSSAIVKTSEGPRYKNAGPIRLTIRSRKII